MKRPAVIAILVAAAAAGFAAGWYPGGEGRKAAVLKAPRKKTPTYEPAVTIAAPAPPIVLPTLESVDDCRVFLTKVNRQYASSHPYMKRAVKDFVLRRWLELDAEDALTEAERQPGNEFSTEGFAPDLFRVWLDLHVDSAISAYNQANPILAKNVRVAFLTALADKDPEKAFEVWKTPRGRGEKNEDFAGEEVFRRWAQRDPRAAMAKAPGYFEQSTALSEWAQNQPREALAYVQNMPNDGMFLTDPAFLPIVLQRDPARAQAALRESVGPALEYIGRNWAERDTAGAVAWAQRQPANAPLVREVFVAAATKLAYTEPERALEILRLQAKQTPGRRDSGEETRRAGELTGAFAALAAADPERIRLLMTAEPELAKGGGLAGYFSYAFASDPAAAITQYREWAENPALKEAATEAVLATFDATGHGLARDPSQLIAAVPELADKVDGRILRGWARANPMSAAEFITQRTSAGKPIDNLSDTGVLSELAVSQPQYTSLWLQKLRDPDLQMEAAETLSANWSAFDPEAAAAWINGLPEGSIRQAALDGHERRRRNRPDPSEQE